MFSNNFFDVKSKCSDLQLLNIAVKVLVKSRTTLNKISTFQNWDNMTSLWSYFYTVSVPSSWNSDDFVTCYTIQKEKELKG